MHSVIILNVIVMNVIVLFLFLGHPSSTRILKIEYIIIQTSGTFSTAHHIDIFNKKVAKNIWSIIIYLLCCLGTMTLSIMTVSTMTHSITTRHNNIQHKNKNQNDAQNNNENVTPSMMTLDTDYWYARCQLYWLLQFSLLCRVSLYWMSLWWMS